ncbi:MAG: Xaa-Pro peptidase family protein [Deltaproteobacteria bacterium]|jgi:Xaa-Pro aminopeptidase|nr:Xaa-Pro peptidase family protein [Deltaproteobacteria bacterium]
MNKEEFAARRENLRRILKEEKLGALLVTLDANRYYLSGFELTDGQSDESAGCLLITAQGKDWLCTDARYEEAALRLWNASEIFIYSGAGSGGYAGQINKLLKDNVKGELGVEANCVSLSFYQVACAGLSTVPADGLVQRLRIIKSPEEIAAMEASCAITHSMLNWLPGVLAHGRTEEQIAWDIEQFFRNHGAEGLAFASIVAIGSNAALPHARPGQTAVSENCCVLVDIGCRYKDYCSDQTRTFWVGDTPPDYFLRTLKQVQEAQRRAIELIRPGAICKDVHAAAYNYFESLGLAKHFNHGLGHGIGLQTHELPRLNAKSETVLRPGMMVTVEPGLYYPEWGGVRWEYTVLVTEDGCKIL